MRVPINPLSSHPERAFTYCVRGNPQSLSGIQRETDLGEVVDYTLLCAASARWKSQESPDGMKITLSRREARGAAKAIKSYVGGGRPRVIPILERTVDEAFTTPGGQSFLPSEVYRGFRRALREHRSRKAKKQRSHGTKAQVQDRGGPGLYILGHNEPYSTLRRGQWDRDQRFRGIYGKRRASKNREDRP